MEIANSHGLNEGSIDARKNNNQKKSQEEDIENHEGGIVRKRIRRRIHPLMYWMNVMGIMMMSFVNFPMFFITEMMMVTIMVGVVVMIATMIFVITSCKIVPNLK